MNNVMKCSELGEPNRTISMDSNDHDDYSVAGPSDTRTHTIMRLLVTMSRLLHSCSSSSNSECRDDMGKFSHVMLYTRHTHTHTHTDYTHSTHTHKFTSKRMQTHTLHILTHIHIHIRLIIYTYYTHTHTHIHILTRRIYRHTYTHTHTHIHTHTRTQSYTTKLHTYY